MDTWVGWLIGVVVVVAIVFALPWLAQRTMDDAGGGGGGNPFGVLQEIFNPAAAKAEMSVVQMKEREQAAPRGEGDDLTGDDVGPEADDEDPPTTFPDGARL